MSKKIIGIALVVIGIALQAIPGIGQAIGLPLIAAGISSATVIGLGLVIAGSLLLGPSAAKIPQSLVDGGRERLFNSLIPTTPRKIVFGNTAGATDARYQAYTGTNQEYLEQIVCVASHKVDAIYELWLDNEKAWDSTSGVVTKFSSFLTVDVRNEGTSSNGNAIDSTWTSTATLTGCAYLHLKFLLVHKASDGSNDSPFASGVTTRFTIRTKGALVYDPRHDGTAGGTGTQRAATQSTWTWDDSASRNPALQLLFYLLGWKINGKLAVGMGLPAARIDLGSFITAANACDESVTLVGGGTEPRYRGDGVISEGDDRRSVIESLCATMNAVLRDSGGKLSVTVLSNDLASPVASFDQSQVLGEIQWDQTPDLGSIFNIVRGRRTDGSDVGLYQPVDYPEASLANIDGIDRIDTADFPLVQSDSQAQRLAKQRLERNQYQGRLTLTGSPAFWQISLGDVFELTHPAFGWADKLFRCAGQQISRTGETQIVAVEENAAIYAWDASERPAVTPGTPTVYDPVLNHPVQSGINEALAGSLVIDTINDVVIYADSLGVVKADQLPLDVPITASNSSGDATALGTWSRTTTSGVTCTIGSATGVLNITAISVSEAYIPISFVLTGVTRTANVHVVVVQDPPTSGGGSGATSASTTTLGNTTGSSYDTVNAVSATMTCAAGAGGQVALNAPISYKATDNSSFPTTYGKWQWRVVSGTFADVSTEVTATSVPNGSGGAGANTHYAPGALTVSQTKTGLTTGTDYEFRFLWRDDGTHDCYRSSGTLSATGS
jgi:hypothetical protein